QLRPPTDDLAAQPTQRVQSLWTAGAIRGEPDLALELCDGTGGLHAVKPVRAAGVVAHLEQALLHLPDVVAHQWARYRVVQRSLAESPAGRVQRTPRLVVDLAIDGQSPALLELAHRSFGFRVK